MMKKRLRRNNFNMVEIMLAVIVIALGIAGTFVLFPVGLNANKDATAENSIADIAEYVTAFVRAEVQVSARKTTAEGKNSNDESGMFDESKFADLFYKEVVNPNDNSVTNKSYANAVDVDIPGSNWTVPDTHKSRHKSSESEKGVAMILSHSSEKGVFLVRQLSGPEGNRYVDFSAVARVYLDNADGNGYAGEYFCNESGSYVSYAGTDNVIKKFILPAVLELSWPATIPFEEREKRYFRFEIFNDQYEVSKPDSQ